MLVSPNFLNKTVVGRCQQNFWEFGLGKICLSTWLSLSSGTWSAVLPVVPSPGEAIAVVCLLSPTKVMVKVYQVEM